MHAFIFYYLFFVVLWLFSSGEMLYIKDYSSVVFVGVAFVGVVLVGVVFVGGVFVGGVFVGVVLVLVDTKTAQQEVDKYQTFYFSPFN